MRIPWGYAGSAGVIGWGARLIALDPADGRGWVLVLVGIGGLAVAHRLTIRDKRRADWLPTWAPYQASLLELQEILGPAYRQATGVPFGWPELKADALRGEPKVRVFFLSGLGDARGRVFELLSAISASYQGWDELLGHQVWGWDFGVWLDEQWSKDFDHTEIMRLWVIGAMTRPGAEPTLKSHRRLIRRYGGLSSEFLAAALGER